MLMDDTLFEYCEPNDADDFIVEGAVRPCCFGSPELSWHLGPREGCFDFAQRIGWGQMNQDLYFRKRWNAKMAACRKKGSLQKPHWGHIPGIHLVQCHAHGFDNAIMTVTFLSYSGFRATSCFRIVFVAGFHVYPSGTISLRLVSWKPPTYEAHLCS